MNHVRVHDHTVLWSLAAAALLCAAAVALFNPGGRQPVPTSSPLAMGQVRCDASREVPERSWTPAQRWGRFA